MNNELRPLGKLTKALDDHDFEVSYAFEDLVFGENSDFLIKFNKDDCFAIDLYTHVDDDLETRTDLNTKMTEAFKDSEFTMTVKGCFDAKQKNDAENEVDIHFFED